MNTPKIFATSAALVLAALGFSGCGAGDTTAASSPSSGAPTVTAVQESVVPSTPAVSASAVGNLTYLDKVDDTDVAHTLADPYPPVRWEAVSDSGKKFWTDYAQAQGDSFFIWGNQIVWLESADKIDADVKKWLEAKTVEFHDDGPVVRANLTLGSPYLVRSFPEKDGVKAETIVFYAPDWDK
ncbi:hypothetical protein ACN08Y_10110 [Rothia sp. P5764]|uniref:hypothetical protein n=1 Tax=Rothia sp. P5764 TaxID=3402654 RepID=UPI003ACDEE03